MTDTEIIKALECCSGETCLGCSLDGKYIGSLECTTELSEVALDLIQRQQEELEKLKNSRDRWKQLAKDFDEASREEEKEVERDGNDDR